MTERVDLTERIAEQVVPITKLVFERIETELTERDQRAIQQGLSDAVLAAVRVTYASVAVAAERAGVGHLFPADISNITPGTAWHEGD